MKVSAGLNTVLKFPEQETLVKTWHLTELASSLVRCFVSCLLPPSLSLSPLFKQVLRNSSVLGRKLTDMKCIRKILSPRLLFLSVKWKEKENVYRILWIVSNKVAVMKINKARDYSASLNYLYPLELSLRTNRRKGEEKLSFCDGCKRIRISTISRMWRKSGEDMSRNLEGTIGERYPRALI